AEQAGPVEAVDLRRRAAEQYLTSGHVSQGIATLRAVLEGMDMRMAATPRGALTRLLFGRARIRLRGLSFRERDPRAIDPAELVRGGGDFLNGRFRPAVDRAERAAALFHDRCAGTTWECDTAAWFAVTARFYLGRYGELARQLTRLLDDAHVRGDLYASTLFSTLLAQSVFIGNDELERARETLDRARRQWPAEGFHIQHY